MPPSEDEDGYMQRVYCCTQRYCGSRLCWEKRRLCVDFLLPSAAPLYRHDPGSLPLPTHFFSPIQTNFLDLLAFSTYGALHFASPIVAGWWIWGFGTQGAASTFGWTLGAQNLAGLATHLVFPNASPWL